MLASSAVHRESAQPTSRIYAESEGIKDSIIWYVTTFCFTVQVTGIKGNPARERLRRSPRWNCGITSFIILFLAANPTRTGLGSLLMKKCVRLSRRCEPLRIETRWCSSLPGQCDQMICYNCSTSIVPRSCILVGMVATRDCLWRESRGQARVVSTIALRSLFQTLKDNIRLVFLNACSSREQARALVETIDCVIGMKESIHDEAAAAFASSFSHAIGFGRSIQDAFDQGMTSLLLEGIAEEDIPELVVRQGGPHVSASLGSQLVC